MQSQYGSTVLLVLSDPCHISTSIGKPLSDHRNSVLHLTILCTVARLPFCRLYPTTNVTARASRGLSSSSHIIEPAPVSVCRMARASQAVFGRLRTESIVASIDRDPCRTKVQATRT
ncbi:hypothetical protein VTN02DRAFT_3722 [Thermoascus thermophilus]